MANKYIRDLNSQGIQETNLDALQESRVRRNLIKNKNKEITDLKNQVSDLSNQLNKLTTIVNGLINKG